MKLEKKDFIELDFTGKVKGGEVFDSTIEKDLKNLHSGHDHPIEAKPFIFPLGEGMFLTSVEDFLIGKEIGKYDLELAPEDAFGKRNPALIQMIPIKVFMEHNIRPVPGVLFNFDGKIGKAVTVSGGRVVVDFNSPLAGKTVVYDLEVKRKVTDINEKVKSLIDFLFRRDLDFKVEDNKLQIKVDKNLKNLVELFRDKFKEILNLDLEVIETAEVKPEKHTH